MLHTISILSTGVFFWLLALNKYPFNQKGFGLLDPLKENYQVYLKVGGTILILYSILLAVGL